MNFFNKIKNNKGSAESAMFVYGIAIFATIVVFALDIFGLTWQRYLATRELSNMSRLYATRASDLYFKDGASGTLQGISTQPTNSELGKEMNKIMNLLVSHGQVFQATLTITDVEGVQLLKIVSNGRNATMTAAPYSTVKERDYGTTMFAKMKIDYKASGFIRVAGQRKEMDSYTITNKFAFEQFRHDETNIG